MPWGGNLQICRLSDVEVDDPHDVGRALDDSEPRDVEVGQCRASVIPPKSRCASQLSDDEEPPVPAEAKSHTPPIPKPLRMAPAAIRARLGKLSISLCGCARQAKRKMVSSCFRQFHGAGMDEILRLALDLYKLSKNDMDKKVRGFKLQSNLYLQVRAFHSSNISLQSDERFCNMVHRYRKPPMSKILSSPLDACVSRFYALPADPAPHSKTSD